MKPSPRRCQCRHCNRLFVPDYRNRGRQQYCASPDCRQASKRSSQQRWLSQVANHDYFRGPENVKRVQQWRAAHPGYWKKRPRRPVRALQETCTAQPAVSKDIAPNPSQQLSFPALQDLCSAQTPLLVGLIAQFTDAALQEDIVTYTRRLIARGQDILDQPSWRLLKENTTYDAQKDPASGPLAAGAGAVQLD